MMSEPRLSSLTQTISDSTFTYIYVRCYTEGWSPNSVKSSSWTSGGPTAYKLLGIVPEMSLVVIFPTRFWMSTPFKTGMWHQMLKGTEKQSQNAQSQVCCAVLQKFAFEGSWVSPPARRALGYLAVGPCLCYSINTNIGLYLLCPRSWTSCTLCVPCWISLHFTIFSRVWKSSAACWSVAPIFRRRVNNVASLSSIHIVQTQELHLFKYISSLSSFFKRLNSSLDSSTSRSWSCFRLAFSSLCS